uniref:Protocadherin beta 2 n=1 Tax=Equus caballus TaxID=9796 RepID=A0A5F5Q256_HORSE
MEAKEGKERSLKQRQCRWHDITTAGAGQSVGSRGTA